MVVFINYEYLSVFCQCNYLFQVKNIDCSYGSGLPFRGEYEVVIEVGHLEDGEVLRSANDNDCSLENNHLCHI